MASSWSEDQFASALEELMSNATNADAAQLRAAGAMGVASLVAAKGIVAMEALGLWTRLEAAAKDKKQQSEREGAALVFGSLGFYLGRTFEPQTSRAVPLLLSLLDDGASTVREAAIQGVIACLRGGSYHGTGRILPLVAGTLKESKWTCKVGALRIFDAVTEFAASTLYAQFPIVMPPLRDALAETHPKVRSCFGR
jgi:HEAT repeat protein